MQWTLDSDNNSPLQLQIINLSQPKQDVLYNYSNGYHANRSIKKPGVDISGRRGGPIT